MRKIPASLFVEVVNSGDEVLVGGVTDPFEDAIQHDGQTAKVIDGRLPVEILAGLPPPAVEPLSELFVTFS